MKVVYILYYLEIQVHPLVHIMEDGAVEEFHGMVVGEAVAIAAEMLPTMD